MDKQTNTLLQMLMGIVILLMIAIAGLFLRMIQLQQAVIKAMSPLQGQILDTNIAQSMGIKIGAKAPGFSLLDLQGNNTTFDSFEGQEVLLAFSSTHCPACKVMYPHIKTFSEQHKTVQVIMISLGSVEESQAIVAEYSLSFPVLLWSDEVAEAYRVSGVPFFFYIDAESMIMNKGSASTADALASLITKK